MARLGHQWCSNNILKVFTGGAWSGAAGLGAVRFGEARVPMAHAIIKGFCKAGLGRVWLGAVGLGRVR